jgi:hypothetical protein
MDVLMDDLAHYTQEIHEEEQWHVWKKTGGEHAWSSIQ